MISEKKAEYTIEHNAEIPAIVVTTIGFHTTEESKKTLDEVIDAIKDNQCGAYLSDLRKSETPVEGLTEWLMTDWLPRALEAGLTKIATVWPEDVFAKISLNELVDENEAKPEEEQVPIDSEQFDNYDDAVNWIKG